MCYLYWRWDNVRFALQYRVKKFRVGRIHGVYERKITWIRVIRPSLYCSSGVSLKEIQRVRNYNVGISRVTSIHSLARKVILDVCLYGMNHPTLDPEISLLFFYIREKCVENKLRGDWRGQMLCSGPSLPTAQFIPCTFSRNIKNNRDIVQSNTSADSPCIAESKSRFRVKPANTVELAGQWKGISRCSVYTDYCAPLVQQAVTYCRFLHMGT